MSAKLGSTPKFTWEALTLKLRVPFRLSYGVTETRRSFWIRLAGDEGWGEAAIPPYYGISDESMIAFWEAAACRSEPLPEAPSEIAAWIGHGRPSAGTLRARPRLPRPAGAACRASRSGSCSGCRGPPVLATCFTIAIDEPKKWRARRPRSGQYETLKIKLGSDDDFGRLKAIRAARPDAKLRVDANAGWDREEAVALVRQLEPLDIELVEQPVHKEDIAGMGYVQARTPDPRCRGRVLPVPRRRRSVGGSRRAGHQPQAPESRRAGTGRRHGPTCRGNSACPSCSAA